MTLAELRITSVDDGFKRLVRAMEGVSDNLTRELGIIAWATAKKAKSEIAKRVGGELAVPQKVIKKVLTHVRDNQLTSTVTLSKTRRLALREFNPRQNRQGVRVRISKTKGAKTIPSAFQGPRPGVMKASWRGNAFKRLGKNRLPIVKLRGPSPWGVFVKNEQMAPTMQIVKEELKDQLEKRIRFLELKRSGGLNWQQPNYVSDQATGEN